MVQKNLEVLHKCFHENGNPMAEIKRQTVVSIMVHNHLIPFAHYETNDNVLAEGLLREDFLH